MKEEYNRRHDEIWPEMLALLKEAGIRTAVVSNKADPNVKALASHFYDGLFDVTIGSMEGMARKPAPDLVEMALRDLGVTAEEAVYIGDSEVDLETAANSHLPMIAVTWGYRDMDHLIRHGAKCFAHRPEELLDFIL